jgi:hypothetical protein
VQDGAGTVGTMVADSSSETATLASDKKKDIVRKIVNDLIVPISFSVTVLDPNGDTVQCSTPPAVALDGERLSVSWLNNNVFVDLAASVLPETNEISITINLL